MCGIVGIYLQNDQYQEDLESTVTRMASCLTHRGPDDQGIYANRTVALGHRRLSIIDLATGHQPMFSKDRKKCIVFNGEIYNFAELKAELTAKGYRFATNSDTETIIYAYEEWGKSCVHKLRGMFAFCIWDSEEQRLFLARDRVGKKPLFYAQYAGKFVFASEMKAILIDPGIERSVDDEALAAYFLFSYVPAPLTVFKNIRKLPSGHTLTVEDGKVTVERYWDVFFEPNTRKREAQFIHEFLDLLEESVRIRLISEVPLGAFLSGGIDSSTVVALMHRSSRDCVKTYTIGFGGDTGGFDDERSYARLVAERYKTEHREHEVVPDVESLLNGIVTAFDEPFADDSTIPSYYVCKMARENVTVALSGLGGDETFAGYERYLGFKISQFYNKVPGMLRERVILRLIERFPETASGSPRINHIKRFVRSSCRDDYARQYLGFVSKLPEHYKGAFFSSRSKRYHEAFGAAEQRFIDIFNTGNADDPLNRVFYCDIQTYLPEDILACTDRMSMLHSLEVRAPFVDHKLIEYCAAIPPSIKMKWFKKKYLLKKGVASLLPAEVLNHRKQGFVGPMATWLRADLKSLILSKLSPEHLGKHGMFNQRTIDTIVDDHFSRREINDTLIWSLLIFQTWLDLYLT
ncbi:MAG: asparagine synthase (glutamine-hydrolyzing) [Nitrososphaera sp.]|nr:asparagine synthase (glutamine-hydrolyzing) [Nitrososphaera sp.]